MVNMACGTLWEYFWLSLNSIVYFLLCKSHVRMFKFGNTMIYFFEDNAQYDIFKVSNSVFDYKKKLTLK